MKNRDQLKKEVGAFIGDLALPLSDQELAAGWTREEGRREDTYLIKNLNLVLVAVRELEPHGMELANLICDVAE